VPVKKPKSCIHRAQLGKNVVSLRKKHNLTQEQLAEQVEVSVRYVQSLEAGEYFLSLPKLVKLKSLFRCGWEELFHGCDKKQ
jgi:transcriptional regulator with XRE-family HTH domain